MTTSNERRRAERLAVQLRAQYRSDAVSRTVEVVNLSRSGLCVRCAGDLGKRGTPVDVVLDLLEGPVKLAGEVVREGEFGGDRKAGIRFTAMDPAVRRSLANYVIKRHHASRVKPPA